MCNYVHRYLNCYGLLSNYFFFYGTASVNLYTYMANQDFHMALMSQLYIHHQGREKAVTVRGNQGSVYIMMSL